MLFPTLLSICSFLLSFCPYPNTAWRHEERQFGKISPSSQRLSLSDNSFFYMYIIIPYAEDLMYVYAKTSIL